MNLLRIMNEIQSARSSLAMEPEPLTHPRGQGEYLVETDRWAAHADKHLQKTIPALDQAIGIIERVRNVGLIFIARNEGEGLADIEQLEDAMEELRRLLPS